MGRTTVSLRTAALSVVMALTAAAALPISAGAHPAEGFLLSDGGEPTTVYTVSIEEHREEDLEFLWSSSGCGDFRRGEPAPNQATYYHPHGQDERCQHEVPNQHENSVRVDVVERDARGRATVITRCSYQGTTEGSSRCARASEEPTPTPTDTPISTQPCTSEITGGFFQPTQGVWQDDPAFEDRPGKQISRVRDGLLHAELPMVQNRATALFGVERLSNGSRPSESRRKIHLRVVSFGSERQPIQVRFSVAEGGGSRALYTTPRYRASDSPPLWPPCRREPRRFTLTVHAAKGLPPNENFTFQSTGDYDLEAEILGPGETPTGIEAHVRGRTVATSLPPLHFVSALLVPTASDRAEQIAGDARVNWETARDFLSDFYPLANVPVSATLHPMQDLSKTVFFYTKVEAWAESHAIQASNKAIARVEISRALTQASLLSGLHRLFIVADGPSFDFMGQPDAQAFNPTSKVVFLRTGSNVFTVGHELAHSVPRHLWSEPQMTAECGRNYHNTQDEVGHGIALTSFGLFRRQFINGKRSMMEVGNFKHWIDQCTYRHLIEALQGEIDPPVTIVQGVLGRGEKTAGLLHPAYQWDGVPDLEAGEGGKWAIVVRDADGEVLGRYPFRPSWKPADVKRPSDVTAFVHQIPRLDDAAAIELVGPDGVLDTITYSDAAPAVSISAPRSNARVSPVDGTATVTWSGTDRDADELVYTVLYSSDGGETWFPQGYEITETSFPVTLAEGTEHAVKIVASDGANTTEATVRFGSG